MENKIKIKDKINKIPLAFAILLTILMLFLQAFFFLYNAKGIFIVSGWICTIFFTFCFFMIFKTNKIDIWRKILFIGGSACFFPSFIAMLIETRGSMALQYKDIFLNETPFCHIVFPMVIVPYALEKVLIFPAKLTGHFASFYAMLVIILISILTIGRGWCSWVCFYGGWDESFSRLGKKPILKIEDKSKKIRFFNFVILFVVILGSLATFSAVFCQWFCPWKLITEYEQITNFSSFFAFIITVLIFSAIVISFSFLTKKRIHCMSYCPFGALASVLGKISFSKVKINENKCTSCGICAKNCPVMAIDEEKIKTKDETNQNNKLNYIYFTCTKCGKCIDNCPQKAIDFNFNFTSNYSKISRVLTIFSGWLLGSIVMGGFISQTIARIINLITKGNFLFN